jgi:hypothetical protein
MARRRRIRFFTLTNECSDAELQFVELVLSEELGLDQDAPEAQQSPLQRVVEQRHLTGIRLNQRAKRLLAPSRRRECWRI